MNMNDTILERSTQIFCALLMTPHAVVDQTHVRDTMTLMKMAVDLAHQLDEMVLRYEVDGRRKKALKGD